MRGDFKEWYRECFAKNWPLGQGKAAREGGRKDLTQRTQRPKQRGYGETRKQRGKIGV
jgi:hypothetical protein